MNERMNEHGALAEKYTSAQCHFVHNKSYMEWHACRSVRRVKCAAYLFCGTAMLMADLVTRYMTRVTHVLLAYSFMTTGGLTGDGRLKL
jgi:hypothetical protein